MGISIKDIQNAANIEASIRKQSVKNIAKDTKNLTDQYIAEDRKKIGDKYTKEYSRLMKMEPAEGAELNKEQIADIYRKNYEEEISKVYASAEDRAIDNAIQKQIGLEKRAKEDLTRIKNKRVTIVSPGTADTRKILEPPTKYIEIGEIGLGLDRLHSNYRDNTDIMHDMKKCAMILCKITPGWLYFPAFNISGFSILDAWDSVSPLLNTTEIKPYTEVIRRYGYNMNSGEKCVKIRGFLDGPVTETFNNEYMETFLGGISQAVGGRLNEINQIMGTKTGSGMIQYMGTALKSFGETLKGTGGVGEILGKAIMSGTDFASAGMSTLREIPGKIKDLEQPGHHRFSNFLSSAADTLDAIAGGQRFDFPTVWTNSTFQGQYSITIRLFCANPSNSVMYERDIVGPLICLLALALPPSLGTSHSYPFYCRVEVPGLFSLPAAAISNIAVSKGESVDHIGFDQRPRIVDVRIDFINLFSVLPMTLDDKDDNNQIDMKRLTLKEYKNNMMGIEHGESQNTKDAGRFKQTNTVTTKEKDKDIDNLNNTLNTLSKTLGSPDAINTETLGIGNPQAGEWNENMKLRNELRGIPRGSWIVGGSLEEKAEKKRHDLRDEQEKNKTWWDKIGPTLNKLYQGKINLPEYVVKAMSTAAKSMADRLNKGPLAPTDVSSIIGRATNTD